MYAFRGRACFLQMRLLRRGGKGAGILGKGVLAFDAKIQKKQERGQMSVFEIIMLVCFGAAWPFSLYKSYVTRDTKGKSIVFLYIVVIGYMSGILHKLMYSRDFVVFLYTLNMLMVSADIVLYYRNRKIQSKAGGRGDTSLVQTESN